MSSWPYHTRGERQQPPLLFLHGFMGCGADWLPIATALADQYYCLMPDLPGHGRHLDLPFDEPLQFQTIAPQLVAFLDRLELERVNMVGYSMGGRLALYLAATFPQKIRALVLEGANPGLAEESTRRQRAEADDRQAEFLLTAGLDRFVEQWYELDLFSSLKQRPELLAALKSQRGQNEAHWLAKIIRELSPGRQPSLWDRLENLSIPVLLLAGALDTKYSHLAGQVAARLPEAAIAIIPEAGHNIHLEQPERFVQQVRSFLGSIRYD